MSRTVTVTDCITRYIDSRNPNENVASAVIRADRSILEGRVLEYYQYALLKFNLSGFAGGRVRRTYIYLYANEGTTYPTNYGYLTWVRGFSLIPGFDYAAATLNGVNNSSDGETVAFGDVPDIQIGAYNAFSSLGSSNEDAEREYAKKLAAQGVVIYSQTHGMSSPYPTYNLVSFQSALGANPPYMELLLDDVEVEISNAAPSSGFVDKATASVFTWGITYDNTDVVGAIAPASAKFRYRVKGAGSYTEKTAGPTSYTMPANTLGDGSYEWQVVVTTNAGTTATSEWMEITTVDAAAVAVPIRPAYAYQDAQKPITFEWSHNTANGTAQTAANLQYSTDGATWLTLANITGASHTAVIPANTFGPGNVFWRVRTHNANGVAGAWSDAAMFRAVAPVPVPVFASVQTGTARPKFAWTAQVQAGFDLEIEQGGKTVYTSGPVISTDKAYTISDYLPDGNYTARLRVYSDEGDTSDWTPYAFSVSTVKPPAPTLTGTRIDKGVLLTVGDIAAGVTTYILRDGLPIYKGTDYKDYATAAEHTYIARAVDVNGCYADSASMTIGPLLRSSFIAPASNLANVVLLMLNIGERPTREYTWSPQGTATFYAGRSHPVYEYSDQRTETGNYKRSFMRRADFDGFMSVVGRGGTMLYRDRDGTTFWCAVTGLSWAFNRHTYDVSFSLIRVAHKEGIAYD